MDFARDYERNTSNQRNSTTIPVKTDSQRSDINRTKIEEKKEIPVSNNSNDNEEWGAIPAFLRRSKMK
jgi:hypothetical protein